MKQDDNFFVGQRVQWNDPGLLDYAPEDRPWVIERIFRIVKFLDDDYDTALIKEIDEGGTEAEVYVSELTPLETDWYSRALRLLEERFPEISFDELSYFANFYWDNLEEDDANLSAFADYITGDHESR